MANISYNQYRFPTTDDFSGAATALRRLQDTYKLSPSLISSGKLGSTTAVAMTCEGVGGKGREGEGEGSEGKGPLHCWPKATDVVVTVSVYVGCVVSSPATGQYRLQLSQQQSASTVMRLVVIPHRRQ